MSDRLLAQDIVAVSREPLLVLDEHLTVVAASLSFYSLFDASPSEIIGSTFDQVANGRLDHPMLAEQLRRASSGEGPLSDFEIRREAVDGTRIFLLHGRPIRGDNGGSRGLVLTVQDISEQRRAETDCEEAIVRANSMLVELNHRVMNSFAMIGAILTMEGRSQQDENCRAAFERMRSRITSIAHLYRNLGRERAPETVSADVYLQNIVSDLIASLSDPTRKIEMSFSIAKTPLPIRIAVPVGLIVNEVVTNSLKYAFPDRTHGVISVEFARTGTDHVLRIADNGAGMDAAARNTAGLGQRLSEAFARQLHGMIEHSSGPEGTTIMLRFPVPEAP
jgi:chemotaxis protein methyltransferase CheR